MTSNELWTLGIAGYAAVVATFAIGWQIYTWLHAGPQLCVTASPDMGIIGGSPEDEGRTFIVVTVVNRGDRPTTITNLCYLYYRSRLLSILRRRKPDKSFVVLTPSTTHVLPYKIVAGEQWMGRAYQNDDAVKMMGEGCLFAVVYHSHDKKGIRVRLTAR